MGAEWRISEGAIDGKPGLWIRVDVTERYSDVVEAFRTYDQLGVGSPDDRALLARIRAMRYCPGCGGVNPSHELSAVDRRYCTPLTCELWTLVPMPRDEPETGAGVS